MPAVFFDLDDTLLDHTSASRAGALCFYEQVKHRVDVDSAEHFAVAWQDALVRHHRLYVRGEITFQEQRRARVRELVDGSLTDVDVDRLFDVYLAAYADHWLPFPDVVPCLEALHGCQLIVITNGDSYHQRRKLQRMGLESWFSDVICPGDAGSAKPDARIFALACERARVRPAEAFHVGDSLLDDYHGACSAGLRGILLLRREASLDPSADVRSVRSLAEVPALVSEPGVN